MKSDQPKGSTTKISTKYKVEFGLVRLSDRESISLPEFRARMAGHGTITQPDFGWIEVTVEVATGGTVPSFRTSRLELK